MLHSARWTPLKIAERLKFIMPMVHRRKYELPPFKYTALSSPRETPPVAVDVDDSDWTIIPPNSYWGRWRTDYALRTTFQFPAGWSQDVLTVLYLPLGDAGDFSHPEALVHIDGIPYSSCDRHHQEVIIPAQFLDGKPHVLALHGWTGLGGSMSAEPKTQLFMRPCYIAQVDEPTRHFITKARVALGVVEQLTENDPAYDRLLNGLDEAFKVLDIREPLDERLYTSIPAANNALESGVYTGSPLDVDVIAAGHAHIDVAWLWTLDQTRNKAARTFSNVLRLMERYPEFYFTQSQPQLYQYIEEDHPDIFRQIQERVAEGRWEVLGGSWVEPDCNASGAESIARQFLLGRRYFRDKFGDVETPVFWLPDTFGYPWALPQLIAQAGLKYFITHKISWNQYNRLPYQSFWWQGLDGTRVLTHFITTPSPDASEALPFSTTYNGEMTPLEVIGTWRNYRQKEHNDVLLTAYGYGDGGGGPTAQMVENARAMWQFASIPRLRTGTVGEFLQALDSVGDRLPVWNGELYLEYHRGTYTSQARTKRNNRKAEVLLHDAEFLAAWAAQRGGYTYPHEALHRAWELACLNQFHDILPGSSIGEVYVDSARDFAEVFEIARKVRDDALANLAAQTEAGTGYLVVNPTSFGGRRVALLPDALADGQTLADTATRTAVTTQPVEGGTLVEIPRIDGYSIITLAADAGAAPATGNDAAAREEGGAFVLENDILRLEFAPSGNVRRMYDKEVGREVLPQGEEANVFLIFEDRPLNYDAWDIDIFYADKRWTAEDADSIRIVENGPVRAALEIRRRVQNSTLIQRVYLCRESRRVDFDTWVDWREKHLLLKVAFPVDVLSPTATYEIQWGNIERPTHQNTSWDWARFEYCGYKWVDLSEGDYGVSVLNDCKYGHDIRDNVLRLTLLKSATSPDPNADQGEHRFTYSLYPHVGDWRSGVPEAAYDLNDPLIVRPTGVDNSVDRVPFVSVDAENVIIETVKQAEDGSGVIVRFFEHQRRRGVVTLRAGFPLSAAYRCNLLEENAGEIQVIDNTVSLAVTPYQIVNLRLIPA